MSGRRDEADDEKVALAETVQADYEYLGRWGYGRCRPSVLQWCNNSKILLACLTLIGLALGTVVNGLVPIAITTLERRFDLTSTDSGVFAGAYKLASMLSLIPIAHYSSKGNKGRYLSYGALSLGLGSLVCTLPQWLSTPYSVEADASDICLSDPSADVVRPRHHVTLHQAVPSAPRFYYYVLVCGQLLHGFGGAPIVLLAVTYMDENVSQMASPVYSSVFMISRNIIGPALGYVLGGYALSVYGDFLQVEMADVHLSGVDDSRWYGAWWVGFVVCGCFSISLALPILGFPARLPEAQRHRLKDVEHDASRDDGKKVGGRGFTDDFAKLPSAIASCLRNKTFTAIILAQLTEAFVLSALLSFTPKIFENLFNLNSSTASYTSGGMLVLGGTSGTLFGGLLIRKLRLGCRGILTLCLIAFMATVPMFTLFLIGCEQTPLQATSCTSTCHCAESRYDPVCHEPSGSLYFSACHAGCMSEEGNTFTSCACVPSNETMVTRGTCPQPCETETIVFILGYGLYLFTLATTFVPIQQAVLRSVDFTSRTLAFGLLLLADGLGAVCLGAAFDTQCTAWQGGGTARSCARYETANIGYLIVTFGVGTKLMGIALLAYARHTHKKPPATMREMTDLLPES